MEIVGKRSEIGAGKLCVIWKTTHHHWSRIKRGRGYSVAQPKAAPGLFVFLSLLLRSSAVAPTLSVVLAFGMAVGWRSVGPSQRMRTEEENDRREAHKDNCRRPPRAHAHDRARKLWRSDGAHARGSSRWNWLITIHIFTHTHTT